MIQPELQEKFRAEYNPDGSVLRRQQMRMLDILLHVDKVCKKHEIKYWLSSGTLLGAVRHGGFIPWDDDLDVEMMRLIAWTAERGIRFIVDESFVDFVDVEGEFSLLHNELLGANKHLVVVKSISKSYGVPGLRLGVLASGDTELIAGLKKEVAIWNINSFGEFYMQIYEKYHKEYLAACKAFREERKIFFEELQQIPFLRVIPSQANYFMCELVGGKYTSHELAVKLLSKFNILIKDCSGKSAFAGGEYIRIAVRDRKDNHYLVESLKAL